MSSASLDTAAALRYQQAADRFAGIMHGAASASLGRFLHDMESSLSTLYGAAADLPDLAPATDALPDVPSDRDKYQRMQGSLAQILGRYDAYHDIFDPADPQDREPVEYLLSMDLTEILEDLDDGSRLLEPGLRTAAADVLWEWRFSFTSHWGRHAATALKVINSLLHTQFVDALEDPRPDA